MKSYHQAWMRLTESARTVSTGGDDTTPHGFATRVAALAMSAERPIAAWFERLSLRAMGVACLLALAAVAVNFSSIRRQFHQDETPAASDDPVAELVANAS